MLASLFECVKSLLKTALEEQLDLELTKKLELKQDGHCKPFYLNVNTDNIIIIENFYWEG